jgi:dimethylargininase
MARCELTHLPRVCIDVARASAQHADYERTLAALGCAVHRLPSSVLMPDAVFVEDTAVVLDELAIVARPGAETRRVETAAVADALGPYRRLRTIEPPGALDGGDVLVVRKSVFIGVSSRTNHAAVEQVQGFVAPFGYGVTSVDVHGCLHLKSAVTALDDRTLLINPEHAAPDPFGAFELIEVDPAEPAGANIVRVGPRLVYSSSFPRTRARVERRGFDVVTVDVSELAKAEGAVTCCSLIFRPALRRRGNRAG